MSEDHLGGCYIDCPDSNTFMPDIWEHLIWRYSVKSVIDVGCGAGYSTIWFANRGMKTLGIEGLTEAIAKTKAKGLVEHHDYAVSPYVPNEKFDLAWMAEFVEHVEEQFINNWMKTLAQCRHVCMTFATPGQGGHHHVCERDGGFWVDLFVRNGFYLNPEVTVWMRQSDAFKSAWGRKTLTLFHNIRSI